MRNSHLRRLNKQLKLDWKFRYRHQKLVHADIDHAFNYDLTSAYDPRCVVSTSRWLKGSTLCLSCWRKKVWRRSEKTAYTSRSLCVLIGNVLLLTMLAKSRRLFQQTISPAANRTFSHLVRVQVFELFRFREELPGKKKQAIVSVRRASGCFFLPTPVPKNITVFLGEIRRCERRKLE